MGLQGGIRAEGLGARACSHRGCCVGLRYLNSVIRDNGFGIRAEDLGLRA